MSKNALINQETRFGQWGHFKLFPFGENNKGCGMSGEQKLIRGDRLYAFIKELPFIPINVWLYKPSNYDGTENGLFDLPKQFQRGILICIKNYS